MRRSPFFLIAAAIALAASIVSAPAQTLDQRIEGMRKRIDARQSSAARPARRARTLAMLRRPLDAADMDRVPARRAVQWLAEASNVPIVINWDRLEGTGVNPDQPVRLAGRRLTAERGLQRVLDQIRAAEPLLYEVEPALVRVMTRTRANRNPVVVVYPVGDLLMSIPTFENAPSFDLSNLGEGGGGSGGGGNPLFEEKERNDRYEPNRADREARLMNLIRSTVEPDIWRANGGLYGSMSLFGDNLVVRAPRYVQRRIGGERSYRRNAPAARRPRAPAASSRAGSGSPPSDSARRGSRRPRSGRRPAPPRVRRRPGTYRPAPDAAIAPSLDYAR